MRFNNLKNLYKSPADVEKYWKKQAENIDSNFTEVVSRDLYNHSWYVTVMAMLKWGLIKNKSRVLEVGCGWGRIIVGLRKFVPKAKITGIDITDEFIIKAKIVLEQEFGQCDVDLLKGDAMELDFKEETFDTIVTSRVLQYVKDPKKAVCEFYRILGNGGRAIICLPNKLNPIRMIKYRTKLYSSNEMRGWLDSAGFKIVKTMSINFFPSGTYRFDSNNRFVKATEKVLQELPGINHLGALSFVVGEKKINE